ncbi:nucleoside-triphosphatase [Clostridium sp.]|uniref:nucleoside-triphosphatase n=1 Tax=Clostridium sp. TaxID=1506 RepID=UPI0034642C91
MKNIKNVFLHGSSGVGKSTIINKILGSVKCSLGGFKEQHILNSKEKEFKHEF